MGVPRELSEAFGRYGHSINAQRLAWALTLGNAPEDLVICHHCDNPTCCNPEHLFAGTQAENLRDMKGKGRAFKGPRPWNARGSKHGNAKLDEDKVRDIRERVAAGEPGAAIAETFGVSRRLVRLVAAREIWKHVA